MDKVVLDVCLVSVEKRSKRKLAVPARLARVTIS